MARSPPSRPFPGTSTEDAPSVREAVCCPAPVSRTLPVLRLIVGVVALRPLAGRVRWPTSAPRLVAEAFVTALAVIAIVWLVWVALWRMEQRW